MPRSASSLDVYLALASVTRRQILDALSRGELTVTRLRAPFNVSMAAVSQQLKVLRRAGLVSERRVGRMRVYQLRPDALRDVAQWLLRCERTWRVRHIPPVDRTHVEDDRWR
jgi:DNA-binding transcriptional ArsR family regulator